METDNTRKLSVAIVGLGKMGLLHASLLSVLPNVQIAALCDKSWLVRKIAKKTLKRPLVTDRLDEFLDLDLDAIFITTPIPSHHSIVREVYRKNIARNLFVEKTLCSTLAQSEELFRLSQDRNGITMVGYMKRFSVTFNKAKEFLDQRMLGDILSFDAYAYSSDFIGIRKDSSRSRARGGVLEDLGSHVIDIALWFFGELQVTSSKIRPPIANDSIDSVSFGVKGSEGLEGRFDISWMKPQYRMPEFGLVIKGTDGTVMVDDSELRLELNGEKSKEWYKQDLGDNVLFLLGEPEYMREDEHFVNSIIRGSNPDTRFQMAMKVDALLEEVRRKSDE